MLKQGLLLLSLFSATTYAQDVIYMKNGSIIKGNITEIGSDGDVDIELEDGEVFTLKEYNIKKITYEKKTASTPKSKKDRIAAYKNKLKVKDAGPSTGYSSFSAKPTKKSYSNNNYNTYAGTPTHENSTIDPYASPSKITHSLAVGSFAKTYLDSSQSGKSYGGIGFAYQVNFSKHRSIYAAYNFGKQTESIRDGESFEPSNFYTDRHLNQMQLAGILSTNNYEGWQFFTGLGYFTETQSARRSDNNIRVEEDFSGFNIHLGLAYSWQNFSLDYRITVDKSSDYDKHGWNAATGNLLMSFSL